MRVVALERSGIPTGLFAQALNWMTGETQIAAQIFNYFKYYTIIVVDY